MEKPFDQMPGVISTTSGYTGGTLANPTYQQVGAGGTGHIEAVQVVYDTTRVSYPQLLQTYWRQVDPFDGDGQFCDQGETYVPAIFVANWPAEGYHQDYYLKNPVRYAYYRNGCGRDARLKAVWGAESAAH